MVKWQMSEASIEGEARRALHGEGATRAPITAAAYMARVKGAK
jgi:hypothetical protein